MTPRQRLQRLFEGCGSDEPVVCLHTWGRYPFQVQELGHRYGRSGGEMLADVYRGFLRAFPHDWLHVREELTPRHLWGAPAAEEEEDPDSDIPCSGLPSTPPRTPADVDAVYRVLGSPSLNDVLRSGAYDHVAALAGDVGRECMVFPNQGAPGSGFPGLSFEEQLILIHEHPDLVKRAVTVECEAFLTRAQAARMMGADGYIFSEGYAGACDLIAPSLFARVFLEPKRAFYNAIRSMGLIGIGYFLGNVAPYLDTIAEIGADGVMIEESKKGFELDPACIRKSLPREIVLFGNLDSYLLLRGTAQEIAAAVREQARAAANGPFVFCNGSPLCPGTPPGNLRCYLACARAVG